MKEVLELTKEDLMKVSSREEIANKIHQRLVEEREGTYLIGDLPQLPTPKPTPSLKKSQSLSKVCTIREFTRETWLNI